MKHFLFLFYYLLVYHFSFAQFKPAILLVYHTEKGQNIKTDDYQRACLDKIVAALSLDGFNIIGTTQDSLRSPALCDMYIAVFFSPQKTNEGTSVQVDLRVVEVATGLTLFSRTGKSGKFYTDDVGRLTNKAIEIMMPDFSQELFYECEKMGAAGRTVTIEINILSEKNLLFSTEIQGQNMPLSDIIEAWLSENTVKKNYHIAEVSPQKMSIDKAKIPFVTENGNAYTTAQFALTFYQFLKTLGLQALKEVRGNSIIISI